mmetsp:Transcript_20429/g.36638  ORF Transcript_20429/g.36638 Transcript_20429/m.36638 type:complete len:1280 (-) Transcript_20429:40-3879(-)
MGGKSSTSKYQQPGDKPGVVVTKSMPSSISRAWDDELAAEQGLKASAEQAPTPAGRSSRRSGKVVDYSDVSRPDDEVEQSFKADMTYAKQRRASSTDQNTPSSGSGKQKSQRQPEVAWTTSAVKAGGANQISVPLAAKVRILEVNGSWAWCQFGEKSGWVPAKCLSTTGPPADDGRSSSKRHQKAEDRPASSAGAGKSTKDSPALPEPWTRLLANTMILHTVQNAMILASYLLELLTGGYGTRSALHIACWEGSRHAVQAVTNGSKKTVLDWHKRKGDLTPLHIASICGHASVVDYLLELDVNPNIHTVHGLNALHISASSSPEISEMLLAGKADASARTADQDTPLHFASCYQQIETMELLLNAGADPTAANNFGVSPLHVAAAYAGLEELELKDARATLLLCAHGANPSARDHHGHTPADIVRMAGGSTTLAEFLDSGGVQQKAQDMIQGQPIQEEEEEELSGILSQPAQKALSEEPATWAAQKGERFPEPASSQATPAANMLGSLQSASDMRLAEENARLQKEVARIQKEMAESQSSNRHLQGLLEQSRLTMEQMKGAAARSQSASATQSSEAYQAERGDMQKEMDELRQRQQSLGDERASWLQERESLQRQLADALAARESTEASVKRLSAERDAAVEQGARPKTPAASRPSSAMQRQAAQLTEKEQELHEKNAALSEKDHALSQKDQALSEKDAELQARLQAEEEARQALGTKEEQIASLSTELEAVKAESQHRATELEAKAAEIARREAELQGIRAEVQRLGGDMQRQGREKEETWQSLQELRAQHKELREQQSASLAEHQNAKSTFQEREVELEGKLKEQELTIEKLQADVESLSAQVEELRDAKERAEHAEKQLEPWKKRTEELHEAFQKEQSMRKRYHNQMQDMKGAIRVFARIRPRVAREKDDQEAVRRRDAFCLECEAKDKKSPPKDYNFDAVFDERSTQEDVFADCRSLIGSTVDGFNVTVFAYGQTGAGKTHTMYGSEAMPGLVPRAADELFMVVGRYAHDCQSKVLVSMFELYRDDLIDLLWTKTKDKKTPPSLDVKKDSRGTVKVENSVEAEVKTPAELLKAISDGQNRRHVAATKMNADSSRSHLICIVTIESINSKTKQVSVGKLTLCDLAGSERLKKSEVSGEQLKEAQSINKSLTALGDVIEALTKQSKHIPYRNHRLTQLLSDSLGGNAKTLMFVNCSPAIGNLDETSAALSYAVRAKNIVNKVEKNSDSQEVARLKKVVQMMNVELDKARAAMGERTEELPDLGEGEGDGDNEGTVEE